MGQPGVDHASPVTVVVQAGAGVAEGDRILLMKISHAHQTEDRGKLIYLRRDDCLFFLGQLEREGKRAAAHNENKKKISSCLA